MQNNPPMSVLGKHLRAGKSIKTESTSRESDEHLQCPGGRKWGLRQSRGICVGGRISWPKALLGFPSIRCCLRSKA